MVRFSRKMESGGDTDMRVAKNPLKLLLGILESVTGDLVKDPDVIAFYVSNPYNIGHHVDSLSGVATTLSSGGDLTEEQQENLVYSGLWHAPVWAVHIAHKLGAFASHKGGFGYYRTLSTMPKLMTGLVVPQLIHLGLKTWLGETDRSGVIHGYDVTREQRIQQYSGY